MSKLILKEYAKETTYDVTDIDGIEQNININLRVGDEIYSFTASDEAIVDIEEGSISAVTEGFTILPTSGDNNG